MGGRRQGGGCDHPCLCKEKTPFFPALADGVIDIIPADLAANSLILAAAEALALPGRLHLSVLHRVGQSRNGRPHEAFSSDGSQSKRGKL